MGSIDRPRYSLKVQRMGGYPRLWWRSGIHLDLSQPVADADVAAFEQRWREHYVRVEWMRSVKGRLDRVLPQTLLREVHNQNVRSWRERKIG